jgi:hypothetical protein
MDNPETQATLRTGHKIKTNTPQKIKKMKKSDSIRVLAKNKKFIFLLRHPQFYSSPSPIKVLSVIQKENFK